MSASSASRAMGEKRYESRTPYSIDGGSYLFIIVRGSTYMYLKIFHRFASVKSQKAVTFLDSFSGIAEEPSRNRKPVGSIHRLPRLAVRTSSKHLSFGRIE